MTEVCEQLIPQQLRQQILDWLSQEVPPARLKHILGVEQMAMDLACCHNLDPTQAQLAGLMHDLAKYFHPQILLDMARTEGLALDPILEHHPHLLHADVGAIVARDQFGIKDQAVLDAIAHHTLGQPQMSPLSCVVFLADTLEPSRGETAELQALRQLSQHNLYQAVWQTCDYVLRYLIKTASPIHPRAILTRNWALQQVKMKASP